MLKNMIQKFIYALFDPRSPSIIRYVGATRDLTQRMQQHNDTKVKVSDNPAKLQWIKDLKAEGLSFAWKLLDTVPDAEGAKKENFWIEYYRSPLLFNGPPLGGAKHSRVRGPKVSCNLKPVENPLTFNDVERNHLIKILNECNGKKLLAAKVLGISRPTIYEKIRKHSLSK